MVMEWPMLQNMVASLLTFTVLKLQTCPWHTHNKHTKYCLSIGRNRSMRS